MPEDSEESPGLEKGDGVVIYAEGKVHPLAVGFMTMSSADIKKIYEDYMKNDYWKDK